MRIILFYIGIAITMMTGCGQPSGNKTNSEDIMKLGSQLYLRSGCNVCHSLNGSDVYGPPLNDIYKKKITVVRKGREIELTADRKYIKRAIVDRRYEKVIEFRNRDMPITSLSDEDAELLVDYLIELNMKHAAGR